MEKVIVIVGPTGVGKTKLSIELAKNVTGEIISGDSMQVYKNMDIGTGKVTESEKEGIPHYMLDIKEVGDSFSVAEFQEKVKRHIAEIHENKKIPIITGGTGLYIQSVLYDFKFTNRKRNEEVTEALEKRLQNEGNHVLYRELLKIDSEYAETIHPNNHKRLIRALEVYETTGLTMSEYHEEQHLQAKYDHYLIGLEMDRQLLYERINSRVNSMIDNGLIDEVKSLYYKGYRSEQAMKAIGYKELIPYINGEFTLTEAIDTLKRNSRRYAKRQYTYFKNKMDIHWYSIDTDQYHSVQQQIISDCTKFLND